MELWFGLSATTTVLLGLLTAIVAYVIHKYHINHYWRDKGITYASNVPLLGYTIELFKGKTFQRFDEELYKKYGKLFGAFEGIKPVLFVSEPELLRDIFVKDFHNFVNRRPFRSGNPIIDSMITVLRDEEWKRVRSIISPTFTTGKLKGMMPSVADCATKSTENFMKFAESGESVECKRLFGNYTLDVIASVAFGTQLDSHNDPDNIFVTNARQAFNKDMSLRIMMSVFLPKIAKIFGLQFFPTKFFSDLVTQIIARRRENKEVRNDFLQLTMERLEDQEALEKSIKTEESSNIPELAPSNKIQQPKMEVNDLDWSEANEMAHEIKEIVYSKKGLSLNELLAQAILFFLAGFDTTATTLTMVCYNLAHNKDAQKKMQTEIDEIWKKMTPVEAVTTSETRYIDAAIKETLRLFPPGVRMERVAGEDYVLGNTGFTIPKGMLIATPVYAIHRDPDNFSEPEKFLPERFLPENIGSITPFTYLPFGSGPRNCVAMRLALMEIKVNLIYLLKELEFDICPETKSPPDFYNGSALLQPKAVHLKVTKRDKTVS